MAHHPPPLPSARPQRRISGTFAVPPPTPIAGADYPRTVEEFHALYPDEPACQHALARLRWPRGYRCPCCARGDTPFRSGLLMGCPRCGNLEAITTSTLFHGTTKPLYVWLRVLWEMAGHGSGTSPAHVRRLLGVRGDQAAWQYVARIHHALGRANEDPLRGSVEVGRCQLEVPTARPAGSTTAVVAIAAEHRRSGVGRIQLCAFDVLTPAVMTRFVRSAVEAGSAVRTGPWHGYGRLSAVGFGHTVRPGRGPGRRIHAALPRALQVAAELQRWLWTTRALDRTRLASYLKEFAFRFPRRECSRGALFYQLLRAAVPVERRVLPRRRRGGGEQTG